MATRYEDLLETHALGNYRELLEAVTLSPCMGFCVNMRGHEKTKKQGAGKVLTETRQTKSPEMHIRKFMHLAYFGGHTSRCLVTSSRYWTVITTEMQSFILRSVNLAYRPRLCENEKQANFPDR
jgi:hypothetical protein